MSNSLFEKAKLGQFTLQNRVVMAPMTRSRAIGNTPNESLARHYGDRATAGLIITEGTSPSPNGLGYARIPGLFNREQATAWKQVTDSVHKKGGHIFVQLMHTGRVSHPANLPKGAQILAPSAVATPGEMWTDAEGMKPYPVPTAMNDAQIEEAIQEYAASAKLALEAGFDGIELHAANGYLMDQFLNTATNQRQDRWGGSIQNRIRFAVEVAKATVKAVGGQHVGIRVSPYGAFNGTQADPEMDALYVALAQELSALGLVYIHIVDHSSMGAPPVSSDLKAKIRENFKGATILSGGYDAGRAQHDLDENRADLIAFGRPFISNPNLVEKLKTGNALVTPDYDTFYTPGDKGYNDYSA